MAMNDSTLLIEVIDRVKRSERERVPLTRSSLADELALLDVPAWRVDSAIYSLEHSSELAVGEDGTLHSTMPPPNRGRR